MNSDNLKNKVVIITGASSGIGRALAISFFKKGANLSLVARSEQKLADLTDSISNLGGNAIYVVADVSNEVDCKKMIDITKSEPLYSNSLSFYYHKRGLYYYFNYFIFFIYKLIK